MIRFLEQTVAQKQADKNAFLYGLSCFLSVFFLIVAALCASGILARDAQGGLVIGWIWLIGALVCLALAGCAFFGRDYLRLEYDYSFTEGVIDVSKVLNNKRRKHLAEFNVGKIISCGSVNSAAYARAKSTPGIAQNNYYINADEELYFFAYESEGHRNLTVLELSEDMVQMIKTDRSLQNGAWHDAEGKY